MQTIKWKRPSGSFIETNDHDDTIINAMKAGWERVVPSKKAPPKKKAK